jgi:clan AA aspartic protease
MNGRVDNAGRAMVAISAKASAISNPCQLDAWIDTGFTSELVLPQSVINSLALTQSGTVSAELADGSIVLMNTYSCLIDWFGQELQIEIVANNGQFPLLGVGLLRGRELNVNYANLTVSIV